MMHSRNGTVLITILIIFVIVFLIGMGFSRFSSSIRLQANRMGEVRLSEMTAHGLATAAFHKIQLDFLSDRPSDDGRLKKILAGPRPDLRETQLDFSSGEPDFSALVKSLTDPLKEQGAFKYSIYYSLDRKDFAALAAGGDAREKSGFIRLKINTVYKNLEDEFHFACPIKVTSAWLPLLSKFNLFIDNSEADKDKWRFNLVKSKPDGDLIGNSPKPLVLYNGAKLAGNDLVRIDNYLARRVGWVYFGGDQPAILNLAQGTNSVGEFFHLYETWDTALGQFVGFYETEYFSYTHAGVTGTVATVQWDKGIADEAAAGVSPAHWFKIIQGTPDEGRMTSNSIFRLYGIDKKQSPTLVLGKVFRGMISARGYQSSPKSLVPAQLFQWVPRNQWPEYISFDPNFAGRQGLGSIATMARDILGLNEQHLDIYRAKYASQATQQGYNASLAFVATNRVLADPFSGFSGWLLKVMQSKSGIDEMQKLPLKIGGYNKDARVPALAELIKVAPAKAYISIDAASAAAELGIQSGDAVSLPDILALRGIWQKSTGTLDVNGWVLIKCRSGTRLVVDKPLVLASNGGIVVDHGDLLIARNIDGGNYPESPGDERGETPKFTLQIVAVDGNILVNSGKIDACLIAGGKVLFGKEAPIIRGSLATGYFDLKNASSGAELYYNQNLALESCASPDSVELLCFRLKPNHVYLK